MKLVIPKGSDAHVDRSGVSEDYPASMNQGFDIWIDDGNIHFVDEADAVAMATKILERMGKTPFSPSKPCKGKLHVYLPADSEIARCHCGKYAWKRGALVTMAPGEAMEYPS